MPRSGGRRLPEGVQVQASGERGRTPALPGLRETAPALRRSVRTLPLAPKEKKSSPAPPQGPTSALVSRSRFFKCCFGDSPRSLEEDLQGG